MYVKFRVVRRSNQAYSLQRWLLEAQARLYINRSDEAIREENKKTMKGYGDESQMLLTQCISSIINWGLEGAGGSLLPFLDL